MTDPSKYLVVVDAWQNQRFKPLQGGWTKPYSDMTAQFSDITGMKTVEFETINGQQVPIASLPTGWEYTSDWEVDKSTKFGNIDSNGWSYATSFETLFDNSMKCKSDGEMARLSLVRRRRWIRTRQCVSVSANAAFEAQVQYMNAFRYQLDKIVSEKEKQFAELTLFHQNKVAILIPAIKYAARGLSDTVQLLSHVTRKLLLVREYLLERGKIDALHARRLDELGRKWRDRGSVPAEVQHLVSTVASDNSNEAERASQNATGSNFGGADAQQSQASLPGFFATVGESDSKVAAHMQSFSNMLTEVLPQDVDSVLEKLQSIMHDCQQEGEDLSIDVAKCQATLDQAFLSCQNAMRVARQDVVYRGTQLFANLSVVSAAQAAEILPLDMSKFTFNKIYEDEDATIQESTLDTSRCDLFLCIKHYHRCSIKMDGSVTIYSAFTKQQRREARNTIVRVQNLLQATLKVFSHEQRKMWEEIVNDLNSLQIAQRRQMISSNQTISSLHAAGWREIPAGSAEAMAASQLEDEEYSALCNPSFPPAQPAMIFARKGKLCVAVVKNAAHFLQSKVGSPGILMRKSSFSMSATSPMPELSNAQYYSNLSRLLTVPSKDMEADYRWLPVTVVVTYDGALLLYEAFDGDDGDSEPTVGAETSGAEVMMNAGSKSDASNDDMGRDRQKWYRTNVLLRINLRGADVAPLLTLGIDAFAINARFGAVTANTSGKMSSTGAAMSVVLLAPTSITARKWLQVCSSPNADTDMEQPISATDR